MKKSNRKVKADKIAKIKMNRIQNVYALINGTVFPV